MDNDRHYFSGVWSANVTNAAMSLLCFKPLSLINGLSAAADGQWLGLLAHKDKGTEGAL